MRGPYFVYMLASGSHELYIGITNDLVRRLWEHGSGQDSQSYSHRHGTTRLVYYEMTTGVRAAIQREQQLKRSPRQKNRS